MRMHMTPPWLMCMNHKNGEHGELHKHRPSFVKQHSISGRVMPGDVQIEPLSMKARHDELAPYFPNHASPYEMPDLSYLPKHEREAKVDRAKAFRNLYENCPDCRAIMDEAGITEWNGGRIDGNR